MAIEVYQEENSFFSSNGSDYDLNIVFKLTDNLPVSQIEISKLIWVLKYIKNVDNDRVNKADLSIPILIWKSKGKEIVVDGLHRLLKAYNANIKYISYKRVTDKIMNEALIKNNSVISKW